jgi:hypothetical protein
MDLKDLIQILSLMSNLNLVMKKVRYGIPNLELSQLVTRNAEPIHADSIFAPSRTFMIFLDSLMKKLIKCFGLMS